MERARKEKAPDQAAVLAAAKKNLMRKTNPNSVKVRENDVNRAVEQEKVNACKAVLKNNNV